MQKALRWRGIDLNWTFSMADIATGERMTWVEWTGGAT